jgi:hypothetical protein
VKVTGEIANIGFIGVGFAHGSQNNDFDSVVVGVDAEGQAYAASYILQKENIEDNPTLVRTSERRFAVRDL